MAPKFLALATTLENLGARWLLAKKVNFVPCYPIQFETKNKTKKNNGSWVCQGAFFKNLPAHIGIFWQLTFLLTKRNSDTSHPTRLDKESKIWGKMMNWCHKEINV